MCPTDTVHTIDICICIQFSFLTLTILAGSQAESRNCALFATSVGPFLNENKDRSKTGQVPDKYRTRTGQVQDKYRPMTGQGQGYTAQNASN